MRRLIVALAVFSLIPAGCSSGEAFVFGEDDLCEWVTEEDVTGFARDAYEAVGADWAGTAELIGEHWVEDGTEYECGWGLSGSEGLILVYAEPVPQASDEEVVAYGDQNVTNIPIIGIVSEHPEFEDDVLISNHAFGRYGFWVPSSDAQLVLSVNLEGDLELEDEHWEVPLFVVANGFLEEMNWTS